MFVRDPVGKLVSADVELGTALGYLYVAHGEASDRIEQLNALGAAKTNEIRALAARYEKDIEAQHSLAEQAARLERDIESRRRQADCR